jgi:hypothetical protein
MIPGEVAGVDFELLCGHGRKPLVSRPDGVRCTPYTTTFTCNLSARKTASKLGVDVISQMRIDDENLTLEYLPVGDRQAMTTKR